MVQELAAANVLLPLGQVFVCAKSLALVPVSAMLLMLKGVVPLLVSVTACAELVDPTFWLPKLTSVGFRLTRGAAVAPAPLSVTDCGLSVAEIGERQGSTARTENAGGKGHVDGAGASRRQSDCCHRGRCWSARSQTHLSRL